MRDLRVCCRRCQGPWRFGRRIPPGLNRSNGSLSVLAVDSLAALFFAEREIRQIAPFRKKSTLKNFVTLAASREKIAFYHLTRFLWRPHWGFLGFEVD